MNSTTEGYKHDAKRPLKLEGGNGSTKNKRRKRRQRMVKKVGGDVEKDETAGDNSSGKMKSDSTSNSGHNATNPRNKSSFQDISTLQDTRGQSTSTNGDHYTVSISQGQVLYNGNNNNKCGAAVKQQLSNVSSGGDCLLNTSSSSSSREVYLSDEIVTEQFDTENRNSYCQGSPLQASEVLCIDDENIYYDNYNMMHHKKYGCLFPLDESRGWDQDSKSFTSVPVPLQVTVKMSSIMNAGKGVFAKEFIPRRTRIGPYKGEVVQKEDVTDETDTSYFWEISTNSCGSLYMDGNNDVHANWMRHIKCADIDTQYNMLPFQYGGMVYYFTTEDITPGSELLVWHEEQYSTQQGDLLVLCGKELVEEYVSNDDAQKYTCAHCQKEFTDKKKLKNHSRSCRLKAFTCEICGEVLPTQSKLYQHIAKHKDCDSTWAGSSTPKQSKAKPQGKRNVKAKPTLPEEVKDTKELTNSDKSVPNSKLTNDKDGHQPYQCQCCSKTFAAPGTLQQHLMTHVESKPFPCPYCSEAFAHEEWLQLHLQYHARPAPHHCMYCSKACTTVAQLQAHTAMHTREMCQHQYCNRTYMEPSILQAHLWEHAQEKRHQCHYCDKSFTHKGALKAHLTTHKGDKQLRCDYCNKTFTKYNGFQSHLRTHIGDKPYQCQYCGVAFSSISGLWEHVRLHTVNKHYHCQHCGQVFTCSTDLQYHLTLHTSY
ncbi:oocyte zinc finger protein XlCOF6-like isoform X3 [Dysidea avara]|uniref:oocyte zinc finger protein XlCOF6-like isoform X3 n=1 Tax=Dysidea avara TaxID=196820 RepID=UPI003323378D